MNKILCFDTETTGLPKNWNAPLADTANWPRIIQLAWELFWEDGSTINKRCELIKPDGWVVPEEDFWFEHGFYTDGNEEAGIPMPEMLDYFIQDLKESDVLLAHNMTYDLPVIGCEMIRYGKRAGKKTEKFCTKLAAENICKLPSKYPGKYKWPTLEEAYIHFFGAMPKGAHQADVEACKKIYLELIKK